LALLLWFLLFYRRYYDVLKVTPPSVTIVGDDRVHRKNEYRFTVNGHTGKMAYRIGNDDDTKWKTIVADANGEYVIPKGEIVDDVYIQRSS
jgi:hypothetical protein